MGQPVHLEECFRKSAPRWPQSEASDIPAGNVPPLLSPSLSLLLLLTPLHLPCQVTNCSTSPLDSQGQNPTLTPLALLLVSPSISRMTCSGFLRPFWRLELPLPLLLSIPSQFPLSPRCPGRSWRLAPRTYTAESSTWVATTSVSNVRTTLLSVELRGLPKFPLPRLSSGTGSASACSSTSGNMTETPLSRSRKTSLRHSSTKTWMIHKLLWKPTEERSRGTSSTS